MELNRNQFIKLCQADYSLIPMSRRLPADFETPLSVYVKLAQGANSYLFESVQGGEKWGRYSIIGLDCEEWLSVHGKTLSHHKQSGTECHDVQDPLVYVDDWIQTFNVPEHPDLPLFAGGLVGYFGYETITYIEPKLSQPDKSDAIGAPDIFLMLSKEIVVFDRLKGELHLITHVEPQSQAYDAGQARLDTLEQALVQNPCYTQTQAVTPTKYQPEYEFEEEKFKQAVRTIRQYIHDGDVMQVVISQRLKMPFEHSAFNLYRALRNINPSPYMFYLRLEAFEIVGASPEILVRLEGQEVCVRPLAGTRPRGKNQAHDLALEAELLKDTKELAEHLMLIDLGRNDIGRICQYNSIELTEKMAIERYSHVMHIVSNVTGKKHENITAMDVLRATFPAGTVSGAPKVRAMEIIYELEPFKRGVYSGAVGYVGWNGNMDAAIAIRTAVVKDQTLFIQAGAGIVADSQPDKEWQETLNKGQALVHAANQVEKYVQAQYKQRADQ